MSDIKINKPTKIFSIPSFLKSSLEGSRPLQATLQDVINTNIESTSSFRYDSRGTALKNSQQLNVDWSKFENHCFFMSAEALVNVTFDQIINGFPFDGSQSEIEAFFDNLTGFEKWCFDQFPKFKGSLLFSQSYITVIDKSGALFPELCSDSTGNSVLNPQDKTFSIETHIFLPNISYSSNEKQIICQKLNNQTNCGYQLYVNYVTGTNTGSYDIPRLTFSIVSGSYFSNVEYELNKNVYNHIVATFDRTSDNTDILLYNNCEFITSGKYHPTIGILPIDDNNLFIGSGSSWNEGSTTITPTMILSGVLDEFKIFHNSRTIKQQQQYHQKSLTSTEDLKLYFKFNEPPPLLVSDVNNAVNSIVLDYSGNSLHSLITNFTGSLRVNNEDDINSIMIYEKDELSPVLFPAYNAITTLNTNLLSSASLYDNENPNLITRLIPEHWILQGQSYEGLNSQFGTLNDSYNGEGLPGQGELGATQMMLSFLYIYARFFDEIKVMIDQFANVQHTSFEEYETTPNTFLYDLAKSWGLDLPPLFNESSIEQYVHAENINEQFSVGDLSLRKVQDELMKRVLIHMPKILKSKGTLYSIQAFLRAIGIDPQNSVRIREYGGPTSQQLNFVREQKIEPSLMLKMNTGSLIVSPFLSASRIEVGSPNIVGSFVNKDIFPPHGISNSVSDGLLTSGSWTVEAIYKWPSQKLISTNAGFHTTQSLCRLCTTGSNPLNTILITNLVAISSSIGTKLNLFLSPGSRNNHLLHELTLDIPVNIFDSDKWNISFGAEKNDLTLPNTTKFFLRVGNQSYGEITNYYSTSSFFNPIVSSSLTSGVNLLSSYIPTLNRNGAFIQIGENFVFNTGSISSTSIALNKSIYPNIVRDTHFVGQISNLRFWSKALSEVEFKEHIKNYKSAGVDNPLTNYGFNYTVTGSFERLRLDTIFQQEVRQPLLTSSLGFQSGSIILIDNSQNNFHLTGTGFPLYENALVGELFDHSYLSPYYDESVSSDKIRIRSAQTQDLLSQHSWTNVAPVYEVPVYEHSTDDLRFSIEFSLIDALNRDIVTIFSTYETLNDVLGKPELMFSYDYPGLEQLRSIYFNRIKEKIDFKTFFDFYQWFDVAIGTFIQQLLPRKTNFKGTNFIIESHMLERHKTQYHFEDMYLQHLERNRFTDNLLVQQVVGTVRKY